MPFYKAVLLAVRKYRINHEPCILSDALNLVGIDSILAVRQRPDFPVRLEDFLSMETLLRRSGDIATEPTKASRAGRQNKPATNAKQAPRPATVAK